MQQLCAVCRIMKPRVSQAGVVEEREKERRKVLLNRLARVVLDGEGESAAVKSYLAVKATAEQLVLKVRLVTLFIRRLADCSARMVVTPQSPHTATGASDARERPG